MPESAVMVWAAAAAPWVTGLLPIPWSARPESAAVVWEAAAVPTGRGSCLLHGVGGLVPRSQLGQLWLHQGGPCPTNLEGAGLPLVPGSHQLHGVCLLAAASIMAAATLDRLLLPSDGESKRANYKRYVSSL